MDVYTDAEERPEIQAENLGAALVRQDIDETKGKK